MAIYLMISLFKILYFSSMIFLFFRFFYLMAAFVTVYLTEPAGKRGIFSSHPKM